MQNSKLYTDKQADYFSGDFLKILDLINSVLSTHRKPTIAVSTGTLSNSKYNLGQLGNKIIWRVTDKQAPQILDSKLMFDIQAKIKENYADYVAQKIITFGNPLYTKNAAGKPMASITILIASLKDNQLSMTDLAGFIQGDIQSIAHCLNIENRMYKRAADLRSSRERLLDFYAAFKYEKSLLSASLYRISDLAIKHSTEIITLEPDHEADFVGKIDNTICTIEGKSTKFELNYEDSELGHQNFAEYIARLLANNSLGSLHGAEYCLFIIKSTGNVICFETAHPENNWLAGQIEKIIL